MDTHRAGKVEQSEIYARQYNFNMQFQSTRTNSDNHAMIAGVVAARASRWMTIDRRR